MLVISTSLLQVEDFSGSQVVIYTAKAVHVISKTAQDNDALTISH